MDFCGAIEANGTVCSEQAVARPSADAPKAAQASVWSSPALPVYRDKWASDLLSRIFDITGAICILAAALPFLVLMAIALQIDSPGPLFYRHRRIGRNGKMFDCMKFRTMKVNSAELLAEHLAQSAEARAEWQRDFKLRDDPRVTRLGRLVRKLSLDEFPQLFNVLRGEMSLVGPRPIIEAEICRYGPYFEYYCQVRPGLTGLWQVSGRNDTSYDMRVRLDCDYVARKSVVFDMKLLVQTVPAVILARGSY